MDKLYESYQDRWKVYERLLQRTRRSSGYVTTMVIDALPPCLPASVTHSYCAGRSIILNPQAGPPLAVETQPMLSVWDLLLSWGGDWMWASIFFHNDNTDISWLISDLKAGMVIGCTDGSFDAKKSSRLCSSGWILHDTVTGNHLAGSFCECSPGAGSYRGEVLGLCALQILLLAIQEWYHIEDAPSLIIYCDNEKAGERAQEVHRRIKPSWLSADVLRSFRDTKYLLKPSPTFRHVAAHMDDLIPWSQLSLPEQLNCMCNALAKDALQRGIRDNYNDRTNRLPRELSAVYFQEGKATSDPAEHIRLSLGKERAKRFLIQEKDWSPSQFDAVAWEHLHDALSSKPVAFRLWLSKQHSDFCASGVQMKRCNKSADDRCPSCWRRKEQASHLCRCPSEARTSLLEESVCNLEGWMQHNDNTDKEILYWVPKYIRARGRIQFVSLGAMSTHMMSGLAISQDLIGWRNFMEGRVSTSFAEIQNAHLSTSMSRLTSDMWMRGFISKLIHISHAQWILRNFMLHDSNSGYLQLKDRMELVRKIEELSGTQAHEVPEESQFLLDIDTNRLAEGDIDTQDYWVHAMEAATAASRDPHTTAPHNSPRHPRMSAVGAYTVMEEIRQERQYSRGMRSSNARLQERHAISESHREALLGSNRRRKPD